MVLRQLANVLGIGKWRPSFATWEISDELYDWIRTNVADGATILELGSGAGTSRLVENYHVYSVEHDIAWVGKEPRSTYIHAPIRDYGTYRWYDADKLKNSLLKEYDVLLVDGPPGTIGRSGLAEHRQLFRSDVVVIVDDTHREQERLLAANLARLWGKTSTVLNTKQFDHAVRKTFTVLI